MTINKIPIEVQVELTDGWNGERWDVCMVIDRRTGIELDDIGVSEFDAYSDFPSTLMDGVLTVLRDANEFEPDNSYSVTLSICDGGAEIGSAVRQFPGDDMYWQQLVFPKDVDPMDNPDDFIREAESIYQKTGLPRNFCILRRVNDDGSFFYLSPVAAQLCCEDGLFQTYRKIHPCHKPSLGGKLIASVVGDDRCLQLL
jgi:hypothetical protein